MYQVFIVSVHKHITYLTLFEKSVIKLEQTITNVVLVQQCLLLRWCLKDGFGVYVLNKRCFEVSHLNHEIKTFLIRQNSSANFRPQFLLLLSSTPQLLVVLLICRKPLAYSIPYFLLLLLRHHSNFFPFCHLFPFLILSASPPIF